MGGHAFYVGGPGMDVLRQLGVAVEGGPPPLERYRALSGGKLHPLPTSSNALAGTSLLGLRGNAALKELLGRVPGLRPQEFEGTSVNQWIASLGLQADVAPVLRAILRLATFACDFDTFGADAAVTQLQAAPAGVRYLDGGWAQLYERLAVKVEVRTATKVTGLEPAAGRIDVATTSGRLIARRVVVAAGTPKAARAVLPIDPGWGDLGPEMTAACLDVGVSQVPAPGYVLGIDEPLYVGVQSPPARGQCPPGSAVVAAVRYGARDAELDRVDLEAHLALAGVKTAEVEARRFLARMVVAGCAPLAVRGGLAGRVAENDSGVPGMYLAGDWVGRHGLLSDAALASGRREALLAAEDDARPA
jgi:hypothetical protein